MSVTKAELSVTIKSIPMWPQRPGIALCICCASLDAFSIDSGIAERSLIVHDVNFSCC